MVTPSCSKNNTEEDHLTSEESTLKNYDHFLDHSIILSITLHLSAYYPHNQYYAGTPAFQGIGDSL